MLELAIEASSLNPLDKAYQSTLGTVYAQNEMYGAAIEAERNGFNDPMLIQNYRDKCS